MKVWALFVTLFLGVTVSASAADFASKHTQPIAMRYLSDDNGTLKEEKYMKCTPTTCCFEEKFYCSMEQGRCICDIYNCKEGEKQKEYWLEISGTQAQIYCMQPHLLHELTGLCLCNPSRTPYCGRCSILPGPEITIPYY
jgi:hypothetical protein